MASVNPFDNIDQRLKCIEAKLQKLVDKPDPEPPNIERFLTTDEACKFLGVSRVTLWNWDRAGILRSFRVGNLKRYRQSEINDLGRTKS